MSILTCIGALAACATKPAISGGRYLVSVPRASFYKYGPAQTFGADFVLTQGSKVTMLQKSFGFSRVMTEDGTAGYVASEEVKPAPPEPLPVNTSPVGGGSRTSLFSGRAKRSNVPPTRGSPLFDVGDVPLPLPDRSAPPKPAPGFRF